MTIRTFLLTCIVGMGLTGCADDACTICERLEECGAISESDIDQCVDNIDDYGADDDVVSRCADCMDDHSCGEIGAGACNASCAEML